MKTSNSIKLIATSLLISQLSLALNGQSKSSSHLSSTTSQVGAASSSGGRKDLKKEFSTLGDSQEVVERIKNLDNDQKVRVVQNRLVDRNNRLEMGLNYAFSGGGDSYVKTQNLGAKAEYHINPRWSLGLEYQKAYNTLTPEGESQFDKALAAQKIDPASTDRFPAVDYPLNSQLATISFYPIYGKLNLFDSGIAQFDVYAQLGYGSISLYSGKTSLASAGLGTGIWLNQRVTTRLEVRYQKYKDLLKTDDRDQSNIQALASLGVLLW